MALDAFAISKPDGQIDLFINGLLQAAVQIATVHVIPGKETQERDHMAQYLKDFFDHCLIEVQQQDAADAAKQGKMQ